jgi:N-glycosidase YbiA
MEKSMNPLESTAFFEEKVPITPRDLAGDSVDITRLLYEKLKQKLEGKCSLHGWVKPESLKILSRSMGYVESGRFTGDIVYHIQVQGTVINPASGVLVVGQVIRKNKMGMYVDYEGSIRIILPRDLHIGDEEYEGVEVGQFVECEIKKSRFQVNDEYILSVGDFRKVSQKTKGQRTVKKPPMKEEDERVPESTAPPPKETVVVVDDTAPVSEDEVDTNEVVVPAATVPQEGGAVEFSSKSPSHTQFSNFYKSKIFLDGKEWPTVEHYFQAQKFSSNPEYQEKIRGASQPAKAKSLGASREFPIRNDWDTYRDDVMRKALRAKFEQNKDLKELLLSTEGRPLYEATTDPYWGQGRNKKGKNRLGVLLMELRDSMSAGK